MSSAISASHAAIPPEFSPLLSLRYDHDSKRYQYISNEGGVAHSSSNALQVLAYCYERKKVPLPVGFDKHWCKWCKYSGDYANVRIHQSTAHQPSTTQCPNCYISWYRSDRGHKTNCAHNGTKPELAGRYWDQEGLSYVYNYGILHTFLCIVDNGVRDQVDKARYAHWLQIWENHLHALQQNSSSSHVAIEQANKEISRLRTLLGLSASLAKLSTRQQVVYSRF